MWITWIIFGDNFAQVVFLSNSFRVEILLAVIKWMLYHNLLNMNTTMIIGVFRVFEYFHHILQKQNLPMYIINPLDYLEK